MDDHSLSKMFKAILKKINKGFKHLFSKKNIREFEEFSNFVTTQYFQSKLRRIYRGDEFSKESVRNYILLFLILGGFFLVLWGIVELEYFINNR